MKEEFVDRLRFSSGHYVEFNDFMFAVRFNQSEAARILNRNRASISSWVDNPKDYQVRIFIVDGEYRAFVSSSGRRKKTKKSRSHEINPTW